MTAFVDESLRKTNGGLYLVTAAVIIDDRADDARHEMRRLLIGKQPRLHWREESEKRRLRIIDVIASISPMVLAYACQPMPKREDRARALCVSAMAWDLNEATVSDVVFESRQDRNDRKDADTIEQARRAGRAAHDLAYRFCRPEDEPLLWIPDALAGATASYLSDGRSAYLERIGIEQVRIQQVSP